MRVEPDHDQARVGLFVDGGEPVPVGGPGIRRQAADPLRGPSPGVLDLEDFDHELFPRERDLALGWQVRLELPVVGARLLAHLEGQSRDLARAEAVRHGYVRPLDLAHTYLDAKGPARVLNWT